LHDILPPPAALKAPIGDAQCGGRMSPISTHLMAYGALAFLAAALLLPWGS
jgi:hypothetical protein